MSDKDYTREIDRMMAILEELQGMPKIVGGEVELEVHEIVNEFYYILGGLPTEDQEAFIGLALATGMVTVDGISRWTEYRANQDQRESEKCGLLVASTDTRIVMPDMQEFLYEKAYTTKRIRRVAKEKADSGDCPPQEITMLSSGAARERGYCEQEDDCERCWVRSLQALLDIKPSNQS